MSPAMSILHRNGGSVRCYQMALGAAGLGDDVMSISGPLLAAPRLFFSGLCSLFPGPAFRKGGLTRAGAGGARDPGQRGRGAKAEPGEAALCTRESITSSRSGWSQTQPYRLQDQLHS